MELDINTNEVGMTAGVNSTKSGIKIEVLDANDNAPEFDKPVYVVDLKEGTPDDTTLSVIFTITDKDLVRISYTLSRINLLYAEMN